MNFTFAALEPEYIRDLASMTLTETHAAALVAQRLLMHRERFLAVQARCGVPALWLMPVFERENPSFSSYFGNGDPLDRPTTHVPRGRGPFTSWEDGVVDALTLDHIVRVTQWTWPMAVYEWELWNGFGPRMHGRPSGYPWAGTSIYRGGKYVADGKWSRGTWDHQLGCVAIAKAIEELDAGMRGFADSSHVT
jgi:lysozyme family protein